MYADFQVVDGPFFRRDDVRPVVRKHKTTAFDVRHFSSFFLESGTHFFLPRNTLAFYLKFLLRRINSLHWQKKIRTILFFCSSSLIKKNESFSISSSQSLFAETGVECLACECCGSALVTNRQAKQTELQCAVLSRLSEPGVNHGGGIAIETKACCANVCAGLHSYEFETCISDCEEVRPR